MSNISKLDTTLVFLDISYAKNVTDEGLKAFEGKVFPCFNSLNINGVTGITSIGLKNWLKSFSETLLDLEMALCDQDDMKAEFFETLGACYNLESVDCTGCYAIDDMLQMNFEKATVRINDQETKPGWQTCHTAKLCGLNISDIPLMALAKAMPNLEHLEVTKCEKLTEFGLKSVLETNGGKLKFLDINHIPAVTYPFLDELKDTHPDLLIKRHTYQDVDFKKDNGLRVPRRLKIDIKKKKKKKGKKGKKK